MNILYVVPYAPTLIRTRPYNLTRSLVRRGNTVILVTLWENDAEREALRNLGREGIEVFSAHLTKSRSTWNALGALPKRVPLQAVYCWQPEILQMLDMQIRTRRLDAVHIEHLRGVRYGLWLKSRFPVNSRPPVVWDSVDCISYLFEQAARSSRSLFGRMVTRLELNRTRRYEGWLVPQFDRVLVTSSVDKDALERLAPNHLSIGSLASTNSENITVLPNGVDLNFFAPSSQPREPDTVVFTGKMSYHANVTAALYLLDEIMPLVWAERPAVRVWIVGKDPPAAIRQLAIRNPQRVEVTGTVTDIRPYLGRAALAICPVKYGAGIQNKVLEAMAAATPVVASRQAVAALQTRDGEHLFVGDDSVALAQKVVQALGNTEMLGRIGQAGRRYVEHYHDWNAIVERLEAAYIRPPRPNGAET